MEKSTALYELKKQIKILKSIKGEATELISVYIPQNGNVNDIVNQLRLEYSTAANIKSKQTRKNVQAAIESLIGMLKGVHKAPENGLAVFAGNINGKIVTFQIIPPEPVNVKLYHCDSSFKTQPLEDLLETKDLVALLTLDRREATFAILKGKNVTILEYLTSGIPGKHGKGGQSKLRFERIHDQEVQAFYKRIAENANKLFADPKIKFILLGGSGPSKYDFVKSGYLHTDIEKKILRIFDTGYTDEIGIKELVDKSTEVFKDLEISREKEVMQEFFQKILNDKATYGVKEVLNAIEERRAAKILISEGFSVKRIKLKCSKCGAEEEEFSEKAIEKPCVCGGVKQISEEKDLADEIINLAENQNIDVETISIDTYEGKQLLQGFGGVGAILRY
ncbi:MAG: peptide chain release factor aRF-1 [archaeon]